MCMLDTKGRLAIELYAGGNPKATENFRAVLRGVLLLQASAKLCAGRVSSMTGIAQECTIYSLVDTHMHARLAVLLQLDSALRLACGWPPLCCLPGPEQRARAAGLLRWCQSPETANAWANAGERRAVASERHGRLQDKCGQRKDYVAATCRPMPSLPISMNLLIAAVPFW